MREDEGVEEENHRFLRLFDGDSEIIAIFAGRNIKNRNTMAKLINLNIIEVKNVINVWVENEEDEHRYYRGGLSLETAERGFMVPQYVAVGVFDDGSTKAGGLLDLNQINADPDDELLFMYDQFVYYVDLPLAKAFVRNECTQDGHTDDLKSKAEVYSQLLRSGVELSTEARQYFEEEGRL